MEVSGYLTEAEFLFRILREVTLNAEFEPGTEHEGLEGRAALVSTLTDEDLLLIKTTIIRRPCNLP